jgi:hypothetical protein
MLNQALMTNRYDLPGETVVELLDRLHGMLDESTDLGTLKAQVNQLVHWIEEHVPSLDEADMLAEDADYHAPVSDHLSLLIEQAQRQNQQ